MATDDGFNLQDLSQPDRVSGEEKAAKQKEKAAKEKAAKEKAAAANQDPGTVQSDDGTTWSTDPSKWTPQQVQEFQQAMGVLSTPGVAKGLTFEGEHGKQLAELPPGGVVGVGADATSTKGQGGKPGTPPGATTTPVNPMSAGASAANAMLESLAGEFTGEMNNLAPYMSGQAGTAAAGYAQGLGQSIGGPGVQAQNPAYAAALAGPQNNVAKAAQAGSADIAQGLGDVGKADAAYMTVSPYAGLLQGLQSEAQFKVETGAATPNVTGTPAWAQAAYADVIGSKPAGASSATTVAQQPLAAAQATSPSSNTTSSPGAAGGSG